MGSHRLPFLLMGISLWIFSACGTSESVLVVEQEPVTVPAAATAAEVEPEERFIEITIGLTEPVTHLDPLFAESLSVKRVIPLLYAGLVTLDPDGEPVYDLASDIEISEDGLLYTITLNRNYFYRSSSVFPTGIGRRIHSLDVKYAFERTAQIDVPPAAAGLLMGVSGFENYFLEQHELFDAGQRVLEGVQGIQAVSAETVMIQLNLPDDQFLRKLASPYLVIYPREAVENNRAGLGRNPIGAGDYSLSRMEEGQLTLLRRERGNGGDVGRQPPVNRINLRYFEDETELMQHFAAGEIDWIPEAGPLIQNQMTGPDGNLLPHFAGSYGLRRHNASRLTRIYLNERTEADREWLRSRLSMVTEEDFEIPGELRLYHEDFEMSEGAEPDSAYYISLTENPFARAIFNQMNSIVFQPESSLAYFDIRIPTRLTSFYQRSSDSLHARWLNEAWEGREPWFKLESEIVSIYHKHLQNIEPSVVPWQLHLLDLTVEQPN